MAIRSLLVVGSGTMGAGIAASFAGAGFVTTILSRSPAGKAVPDGVAVVGELPAEAPDLTIESIPEDFALKAAFFERFERAYGERGILASNTSSLPLQAFADRLNWPQRFAGMHYYHPADAFPLVEVVRVAQTTDAVRDAIVAALHITGKEAVVLEEPVVGFLVNRLQHAILREAYDLIERGVARAEEIDMVARLLLGPRMCVTGLIRQKDLSGLAVHLKSHASILPTLAKNDEPSPLIAQALARGGFYDWSEIDREAFAREAAKRLARVLAAVQG
ncbi:MAG TPA: 3-hydroxyacyl-CoA dehydrogenase NAD-binding domain-containing protein [Candidatus Acidoferrales bacterium]|nr:3-hydroxyacyl-CoA dehydrogenase NAD-binding domain-containing protein [Candidatus Acidoferrales bacterium]